MYETPRCSSTGTQLLYFTAGSAARSRSFPTQRITAVSATGGNPERNAL